MRMPRPAICLSVVVSLLLLAQAAVAGQRAGIDASGPEEFRTWTDRSGTYRTEAVLVEIKSGAVLLKKKDGATVSVPRDRLSDADQRYVETFAAGAIDEKPTRTSAPDSGVATTGEDETADAGGRAARTDARDQISGPLRARTSYRTTARTTPRTTATSPGNRGTRQVTVEGVGPTPEEALKDCFRNAVAVVMGTIVDAETQVEDDKLVLDRILTFTDGFVESYDEVDEARVEDGLVHRRITATVRRDSLLLACGRAESMSVDARGLYPEAMTKLQRLKSARALLQKTLDGLPGSVLQIQLAGRPPLTRIEETNTTVAPELTIRVDLRKYDALQDRMNEILKCLAKQSGTVSALSPTLPRQGQGQGKEALRQRFVGRPDRDPNAMSAIETNFGPVQALMLRKFAAMSQGDSPAGGDASPVLVLLKRKSDWSWFQLDERVQLPPSTTTTTLAFRDAGGKEIKNATVTLGPWVPAVAVRPDSRASSAVRTVFISPSFLCYEGEGCRIPAILFANSLTVRGQVTVENEQLSRLDKIDAGVLRPSPSQE